jgi:hypothetical protein
MDDSMSFELLMEVLGQLNLELPIDGRANTAVDVLLGLFMMWFR